MTIGVGILIAAVGAILAFADFVDQNRDKVKIEGSTIRVADPSVQPRLQSLMDAMRAKQQAIQKAQQRLREVVRGS